MQCIMISVEAKTTSMHLERFMTERRKQRAKR